MPPRKRFGIVGAAAVLKGASDLRAAGWVGDRAVEGVGLEPTA